MKILRRKIRQATKNLLRPLRSIVGNEHRVNVAMIHIGRCGSTVLANMLKAHDDVYWAGEFYTKFFRKRKGARAGGAAAVDFHGDPIVLLQDKMASHRAEMFGFEIKPYHNGLMRLPLDKFVETLEAIGFTHYIVLDRTNRLRKIVSSVIANQPGNRYHIDKVEKAKRSPAFLDVGSIKIDYDDKPLATFLEDYDEQFLQVSKVLSGRNVLKLTYEEDIQEDPRKAYAKVCEFIGLPQQSNMEIGLNRTNPFPMSVLIDNYDEVVACLQDTPYEWMLER